MNRTKVYLDVSDENRGLAIEYVYALAKSKLIPEEAETIFSFGSTFRTRPNAEKLLLPVMNDGGKFFYRVNDGCYLPAEPYDFRYQYRIFVPLSCEALGKWPGWHLDSSITRHFYHEKTSLGSKFYGIIKFCDYYYLSGGVEDVKIKYHVVVDRE